MPQARPRSRPTPGSANTSPTRSISRSSTGVTDEHQQGARPGRSHPATLGRQLGQRPVADRRRPAVALRLLRPLACRFGPTGAGDRAVGCRCGARSLTAPWRLRHTRPLPRARTEPHGQPRPSPRCCLSTGATISPSRAARAPGCTPPTAAACSISAPASRSPAWATPIRIWWRRWPSRPASSGTSPTCSRSPSSSGSPTGWWRTTFADTVFVCNSGAEAIEACDQDGPPLLLGPRHAERHRIITFEGAFHGRTMAGISAVGSKKMVEGFDPLLPGFDIVPFGDREALHAAIGPETAAILIEPIQGEGGIRLRRRASSCRSCARLCDEHGLLLVLDEIQAGMGRTGTLLACEQAGVRPDIAAIAKGLGGGFPIGACLATAHAASGMTAGTHGSTFGGNPLACAVANAVLDVMLADGLPRPGGRARPLPAPAPRRRSPSEYPERDRRGARPRSARRHPPASRQRRRSSRRCRSWAWSPSPRPKRSCACCRRSPSPRTSSRTAASCSPPPAGTVRG